MSETEAKVAPKPRRTSKPRRLRKTLKTCAKCGRTTLARRRQRFCHLRSLTGFSKYWCYGKLERVRRERETVELRPQDEAAKQLAKCRANVKKAASKIKRATTSMKLWQTRAERYARIASMTDEEYAAQRAEQKLKAEERANRKRRSRRSITLV
jgi:hypothetical protein